MKYAEITFNLIQRKVPRMDKQQWQNFIDFSRENEILPFISYLLERAGVKIPQSNLERELYVLRHVDILRTKVYKRELVKFAGLTLKYKPLVFKGGLHLIKPYWLDYNGYISQDIDLLFHTSHKSEILNELRKDYHILEDSCERVTVRNHEETVTFDLHFYPLLSNKNENQIFKLLVESSSKVTIDGIKLKIPDIVSSITYRIFHMFFHHHDFPPPPMRDFLDLYFLLRTIKQPEILEQLLTSLKQTGLRTFFTHLCHMIPGETPCKLNDALAKPISKKLLSLLRGESSSPSFLRYPIARAILWRIKKMETQRNTEFLNLMYYSLVKETLALYTSSISRTLHMLKTAFLTIPGEIFMAIK